MEQPYTRKRIDGKCPFLEQGICRISGVKAEIAEYSDKNCCRTDEWNKCRVYTSQFYYDPNDGY